jgi:hypothetical protein
MEEYYIMENPPSDETEGWIEEDLDGDNNEE